MTVEASSPEPVIGFVARLEGSDVFGSTQVSTITLPTQNDPFYRYRLSVTYAQNLMKPIPVRQISELPVPSPVAQAPIPAPVAPAPVVVQPRRPVAQAPPQVSTVPAPPPAAQIQRPVAQQPYLPGFPPQGPYQPGSNPANSNQPGPYQPGQPGSYPRMRSSPYSRQPIPVTGTPNAP